MKPLRTPAGTYVDPYTKQPVNADGSPISIKSQVTTVSKPTNSAIKSLENSQKKSQSIPPPKKENTEKIQTDDEIRKALKDIGFDVKKTVGLTGKALLGFANNVFKTIGASQQKTTVFGETIAPTGTVIDYGLGSREKFIDYTKGGTPAQRAAAAKNNITNQTVTSSEQTKTPTQFIKKNGVGFVDSRTNIPINRDGTKIPNTPLQFIRKSGTGFIDSRTGQKVKQDGKPDLGTTTSTVISEEPSSFVEEIKKETPKKEDKVIKEDVDKIVGNQNNIDEDNAKKVLEDLTKEEIAAVNNASSTKQKNDIMKYFNKLQDEITRRTISQLRTGKEQALLGLGQAQAAIAPQYESQRARAATTSMQQARNFSEYLAARGQSTSGLAAQAELSRGSGLTRQLGEIGQQQQATQDQLNANKAKIQSDFQLAIANAKSNAEVTKLNQALAQAMKQEDRAYSEQIYEKQKQDRLNEIRSGREWQLAFSDYQNAINKGNTEEAQKFQIKMFELEQQASKDLATFRASLEPPAAEKPQDYNYKTDSNFANALQQLQSGNVEENYNDIVQNASDYIYAFGYEGYNEIKKQLEGILNRNPFLTQ
jgi:hypothetical protein